MYRTAFSRSAIAVLLVIGLISLPSSANAATLGNLTGKWSYPSTVSMPKGNCGTFTISFKVGFKTKAQDLNLSTTFTVGNAQGDLIAASTVLADNGRIDDLFELGKTSGDKFTHRVKFCKKPWKDDFGDVFAGVTRGNKRVEVEITGDGGYFQAGVIRFV